MKRQPRKGSYILPVGIWKDGAKSLPVLIIEINVTSAEIAIREISSKKLDLVKGCVWFFYFQNKNCIFGILREGVWRSLGTRDPYDNALQEAIDLGIDENVPFQFSIRSEDKR